ncbi:hypothetical protein [Sphingomonas sp. MMS24-J13]|uniref:hypothetical protein n=1 Tax=Sphingomonas sp. MMS24-J13 TaxID=3238686 RepID=UPI00384B1964
MTLFTPENMERFGFFRMFEESERELRHRETVCDTNFTDQLIQVAKTGFSFYTFNHPTPNVFAYFVGHVRNLLTARGQARSSDLPMNAMLSTENLGSYGVWPVYPELKEMLNPNFPVSRHFILPEGSGGEVISRDVFVQRSITMYERAGREKIAPLRQAIDAKAMVDLVLA